MNPNDPLESVMEKSFRVGSASPELKERVREIAPAPSRQFAWVAIAALGMAAAGVLVFAVCVVGTPITALADEILQAAKDFHGHTVTYDVDPKGKLVPYDEMWREPGKLRVLIFGPGGENDRRLDASTKVDVSYSVSRRAFRFQEEADWSKVGDQDKGPGTLQDFLNSPEFSKQRLVKTGRGTFMDKPADFVQLKALRGAWFVYADPQSHQILGSRQTMTEPDFSTLHTVYNRRGGQTDAFASKLVDRITVYKYDTPSPDTFSPVFDIDGRKVDAYGERAKIEKRLSKPVATYAFPGGHVMIHDVTVNPHGDLFVLYTDDRVDPVDTIPEDAKDNVGGVYVRGGGFRPFDISGRQWQQNPRHEWPGYILDGKELQGYWYIRVAGKKPAGRVTIGFSLRDGGRGPICEHTQVPNRTADQVPDYMPFMDLPVTPQIYKESLDDDEADYLTKVTHDYRRAESYCRKAIEELNPGSPLLRFPEQYVRLGLCLEQEGKLKEALAQLRIAKKIASAEDVPFRDRWTKQTLDPAIRRVEAKLR